MVTDAGKPDAAVLAQIEAHAVLIAQEAGKILLECFNQPLDVQFKGKKNTDPVTIADKRSEEYLRTAIAADFPDHAILGEEAGALAKADSPYVWVLDPLDGTANFMNGLPFFAVSVGVLWQRQPVAGAIWVPVSQRGTAGVYHARLGNGAYLDAEKINILTAPPGRFLAAVPFGDRLRLSGKSGTTPHEARNTGSIAVEMAYTAGGIFQYSLFGGPKIWDVAAGVVLMKEAGGQVFTHSRKARQWASLERFETPFDQKQTPLEQLKKWSAPLVTGSPTIAGQVVQDLHVTRSPFAWLKTLRRRAGGKGNHVS